jgi:hypothetical protein
MLRLETSRVRFETVRVSVSERLLRIGRWNRFGTDPMTSSFGKQESKKKTLNDSFLFTKTIFVQIRHNLYSNSFQKYQNEINFE